jgi:hypothetical protein
MEMGATSSYSIREFGGTLETKRVFQVWHTGPNESDFWIVSNGNGPAEFATKRDAQRFLNKVNTAVRRLRAKLAKARAA